MNATCLPSGDQAGLLTVAPAGTCTAVGLPVAASMIVTPADARVVSARARLALGSTCSPAK